MHRAALKHRQQRQVFAAHGQVDLFKQARQQDVAGLVDHQTEGTALAVLAHEHHTATEKLVAETGHRNQEMIGQVDGGKIVGHGWILSRRPVRSAPPCNPTFQRMNTYDKGLMWFRRDLRAEDNAALYHALKSCRQVWCVFVFDTDILEPLLARGLTADRRVAFIRESLVQLDARLRAMGREHGTEATGLIVRHARAKDEIPALARQLQVQAVFANHDDEPDALARDAQVLGALVHAARNPDAPLARRRFLCMHRPRKSGGQARPSPSPAGQTLAFLSSVATAHAHISSRLCQTEPHPG